MFDWGLASPKTPAALRFAGVLQRLDDRFSVCIRPGKGLLIAFAHMKALTTMFAIFFLFIGLYAEDDKPAHSAVSPAPRSGGWMNRHEAFNQRVANGNVDLIFIGDSITHGWEGKGKAVWEKYYTKRNAVNLGIGGDRTEHVLWRLDNGNIKNISPKVAVVMIGTNNSGNGRNTAEEMIDGVTAVIEKLRAKLPKTEILLLDIFPRGQRINAQRGKILQVNQVLSRLDSRPHVTFLRIGQTFVSPDGSIAKDIMPDFLHLTPNGYEIWAKSIEPTLARLMGE
jgi:beta-glucosidase